MAISVEEFVSGMQRLAAAVTVVATEVDGARSGLTASAVTSLTAEPPTLLACVNRDAGSHRLLLDAGRFSVNVLAADQEDVAGTFAGLTGVEGPARFSTGAWREGELGLPVLDGALVSFECTVDEVVVRSSHDVFIGAIEAVHLGSGEVEPLLYLDRTFGGFAHG
jgi:flavin reductase (DIM6/NTAB) family NADH-FMN oxidoreductase RutF